MASAAQQGSGRQIPIVAELKKLSPISTLRGRLLVGAVLLWGLLCLIFLGLGWQAGRLLVNETNHQHLRYEAELIRNMIDFQVNKQIEELEEIAEHIQQPREGVLNQQLLQSHNHHFEALVLFDHQSRVRDTWPIDHGSSSQLFIDREYVRSMHAFQTTQVSEPIIGRLSGSPLVMMQIPLFNEEGEYTGFLCGVVNIEKSQLFKNFDKLRVGDNGYVTITTAGGYRIYSPYQQLPIERLPDSISPTLDLALMGWEGESLGSSLSGEDQLVAYRQIWSANWVVGVHLPKTQAEAPLISGMHVISTYVWGLLLLLLPVIAGLIWLALRSLTTLAKQILELREEKRSSIVIPTQMDELRRVIDVINDTESSRQKNLQHVAEREAILRRTLEASPQGMFVTNNRGLITFVNEALQQLLGESLPQSLKAWSERIEPEERQGVLDAWLRSLVNQSDFARQFRFQGADGRTYWLDVKTAAVCVKGEFIGTVGTVQDITRHRNEYDKKRWEAEHDPLTGLLNRRGLTHHLESAFIQWQETQNPTAIMLFDLDRFKPINDQGGHALGDLMLQHIANIVRGEIRSSDYAARQGGDEFAIVLPGCTPDRALKIAESLRACIESSALEADGQFWSVTASIGVSSLQQNDDTIDDVLNRADAASYRAKQGGRNKVENADYQPVVTSEENVT